MSYNDSLHDLTFQSSGKKYRLTRMRNFHNTGSSNAESIHQILPSPNCGLIYFRQLIQLVCIADLRKFLAPGDNLHSSRDDEPIRIRVTSLFLDGTLRLFEYTKPVSQAHKPASTSVPKKATVTYDDVNALHMQSPANLLIHQQPYAKPDTTSKEVVDETMQSDVLRAAAQSGAALYERCLTPGL